jgi:hypothetical protein
MRQQLQVFTRKQRSGRVRAQKTNLGNNSAAPVCDAAGPSDSLFRVPLQEGKSAPVAPNLRKSLGNL